MKFLSRKSINILCTTLFALVTMVWLSSGWIETDVSSTNGRYFAFIDGGCFSVHHAAADMPVGNMFFSAHPIMFRWWFDGYKLGAFWGVTIPLWVPAILILALLTWSRVRVRSARGCPKCGYDLAGLSDGPGSRCPECGLRIETRTCRGTHGDMPAEGR